MCHFKLGDEKYAVISRQGPTLCFDPPVDYKRDNISEKVLRFYWLHLNIW